MQASDLGISAIILCSLAVVAIIMVIYGIVVVPNENVAVAFPGFAPTHESVKIDSYYCADFKPAGSDEWVSLGCVHNVITNAGRNHIRDCIGGGAGAWCRVNFIALGNGSAPTAASTTLDGEQTLCGLARKSADFFALGVGWWEINTTFTYTCDTTIRVNTTASFNATTGNTLFAGGTIPEIVFATSGDQARIRHNKTVS